MSSRKLLAAELLSPHAPLASKQSQSVNNHAPLPYEAFDTEMILYAGIQLEKQRVEPRGR